jgi:hypothetical protein
MTIVGASTAYGIPVANNASLVPAANTTITAVNIPVGTGTGTITLSQPANATYSAGGAMTAGFFIPAAQVSWSVGSTTALQFPSSALPTGAPYGTISSTGLYTAPTAYPPTVVNPHTAIVQAYSYACIPTPATNGVAWSASGTASVTINFP